MTGRHVVVLAVVAAALTALSVVLSLPGFRDLREDSARRLIPFAWKDAAKAVVTRPGGAVSLVKETAGDEPAQWRMELADGMSDVVSPEAAESLAALAALTWRERVAGRAAPQGEGVVTLDVTDAGGEKVSIAFGDVADGLRSVVVVGDDGGDGGTVYGVNQSLTDFLDWPPERWRSMFLAAPGGGARPERIRLSPAGSADSDRKLDIALEEQGAGWAMTEPVQWPVDENRLDILLRWLDRLRADGIAAEMTGDAEYFGFDGGGAAVEIRYRIQEDEFRRRIEFGGDAGGGKLYVRDTSRSPVFTIPKEVPAEISLDIAAAHPDAWRNFFRQRRLDRIGNETPARAVVEKLLPEPVKLTIELSADPAASGWTGTLEENGRTETFAVDAPDGRDQMLPLAALFTGLASLRVKNFLADAAPGEAAVTAESAARWTAHPAWRFSLFAADGRELPGLTLYAHDASGALPSGEPYAEGDAEPRELSPLPGVAAGAGIAFGVPERGAVMETFSELSYLLCLPPYRYRSRQIIDADVKDWTRVELTHNATTVSYIRKPGDVNEQWWRDGASPEPLMDGNNSFVALLLQLSRLRAEGFVQDVSEGHGNFGLDRPAITAIVYSSPEGEEREAPLFALSLGDEEGASGARRARLNGEGPVFLVSRQISSALGVEYK